MHKNLNDWLVELEKIHPLAMDFKLERIQKVYAALNITPIAPLIITVAGTNGKGSTSNTIAAICHAANVSVGLYTSPHLHHFNERIQINGQSVVPDQDIIEAFEVIQKARKSITLTYFEYATLAAFYLFKKYQVTVAILEVGLGGRLDATNIVDADIAVITPIHLDHTTQLGNTIDAIAYEKAGIIKPNAIAISAEKNPSPSITQKAKDCHADFIHAGENFNYHKLGSQWQYEYNEDIFTLPLPKLQGAHQLQNAATAITALLNSPLRSKFTENIIATGLLNTQLKGRFEHIIYQGSDFYFDVTHNPQGAMILQDLLKPYHDANRNIIAVLGMLKDKDAANLAMALKDDIQTWILASLEGERGQTSLELQERIQPILNKSSVVVAQNSVADACQMATELTQKNDIILVFGSFHTVSEGLTWINQR